MAADNYKKLSDLIVALVKIMAERGDLPVAGESDRGVTVSVIDADGHDVIGTDWTIGPAASVFIETA